MRSVLEKDRDAEGERVRTEAEADDAEEQLKRLLMLENTEELTSTEEL